VYELTLKVLTPRRVRKWSCGKVSIRLGFEKDFFRHTANPTESTAFRSAEELENAGSDVEERRFSAAWSVSIKRALAPVVALTFLTLTLSENCIFSM
jgi:hypothetical protein